MDHLRGYTRRAWNDLTGDKRWWMVVLALGLLNCIPIIGPVISFGYLFDWAKEGSWNMDRPLPREPGNVWRRCKYGLYALVNALVWSLPCYIVGCLLALIPTVGWFLQVVCNVLVVVALVLSGIGTMRSTVYERVYPGLQVAKVLRMAQEDVLGLLRVFCIGLCALAVVALALLLILIPAMPLASMIETSGAELLHGTGLISLIALGMVCIIVGLVVWVAATVCITLVFALSTRSMGYWLGQFDPSSWGSPEEPMPFEKRRKEQAGPVRPPRASEPAETKAAGDGKPLDELLVPIDVQDASEKADGPEGDEETSSRDGSADCEAEGEDASDVPAGRTSEGEPAHEGGPGGQASDDDDGESPEREAEADPDMQESDEGSEGPESQSAASCDVQESEQSQPGKEEAAR